VLGVDVERRKRSSWRLRPPSVPRLATCAGVCATSGNYEGHLQQVQRSAWMRGLPQSPPYASIASMTSTADALATASLRTLRASLCDGYGVPTCARSPHAKTDHQGRVGGASAVPYVYPYLTRQDGPGEAMRIRCESGGERGRQKCLLCPCARHGGISGFRWHNRYAGGSC
jgi:hypothetical protein